MGRFCTQCGAPVSGTSAKCEYCGAALTVQHNAPAAVPQPNVVYQQVPVVTYGVDPAWPVKSKIAAGLLAFFVGGLGIHKFYLGRPGAGILMLLFCWTYIPAFIAFIDGIVLLCSSDESFQQKYHCRVQ